LATIDEFRPTQLTDLIGHIYEAAVDPAHWDVFLAALERIYPGSRVTLCRRFARLDGHHARN
jgi:hypothetical protein